MKTANLNQKISARPISLTPCDAFTLKQNASMIGALKQASRVGVLASLLFVAACGSSDKKIVSEDNSADYRNTTQLPLLKKPARAAQSTATVASTQGDTESAELASTEEALVQAEPALQAPSTGQVVTASIVRPNERVAQLQLDQGFDLAWVYLAQQLQGSDITVFSRNKSAGRIDIGCGSVEDAPTVQKKGGWLLMGNKKAPPSEHCALQTKASEQSTLVSVLNRDGEEIGGQDAEQLFQRLLKNQL